MARDDGELKDLVEAVQMAGVAAVPEGRVAEAVAGDGGVELGGRPQVAEVINNGGGEDHGDEENDDDDWWEEKGGHRANLLTVEHGRSLRRERGISNAWRFSVLTAKGEGSSHV